MGAPAGRSDRQRSAGGAASRLLPAVVLGLVIIAGCSANDAEPVARDGAARSQGTAGVSGAETDTATSVPSGADEQRHPDVIDAVAERSGDGTWRFDVTMSSPYDTPERYADAWRVLGPDGTELGTRVLTHDHANEQPFTRSLAGVEVPDGVTSVTIEGRDLANGWGGATFTIDLTG